MRIKSLEVLTSDLEGTGRFYQEVLELPVHKENQGTISIQLPSSILRFHQSEEQAQYHIAFNIPHNMIHEAFYWLDDVEPIPVDEGQVIADFRNWNAASVYFLDNNKNILEFIARRDLPN